MKELIKITSGENGDPIVSARDLHWFLEVATDFTDWCKRMFGYGFVDGVDFSLLKIGERSAHNKTDYALTLDCAKEISMIQRSEKGRQARQYFIECEKRAKNPIASLSRLDIAKMLLESEEEREAAQKQLSEAKEQIQLDAPKVLFANSVSASSDSVLIKELAGYLMQNGVNIGQNRLFTYLRGNGFLCGKGEYYNLPTQRSLDMNLFEVKVTAINKPDGTILTTKTTKVTGKGMVYFLNRFLRESENHTFP